MFQMYVKFHFNSVYRDFFDEPVDHARVVRLIPTLHELGYDFWVEEV